MHVFPSQFEGLHDPCDAFVVFGVVFINEVVDDRV